MSTAHVPFGSPHAASDGPARRPRVRTAYLANLAYLVWFWVMFAAGYWVYSWFGLEPGIDVLGDAGTVGSLASVGWGVVAALPSWVGAGLALRAIRESTGHSAVIAVGVNLVLGCVVVALMVIAG